MLNIAAAAINGGLGHKLTAHAKRYMPASEASIMVGHIKTVTTPLVKEMLNLKSWQDGTSLDERAKAVVGSAKASLAEPVGWVKARSSAATPPEEEAGEAEES